MRTNIEIDDELMREAMRECGHTTKRATVEAGLRLQIERRRRQRVVDAFGKYPSWEGDIDVLRGRKQPDDAAA